MGKGIVRALYFVKLGGFCREAAKPLIDEVVAILPLAPLCPVGAIADEYQLEEALRPLDFFSAMGAVSFNQNVSVRREGNGQNRYFLPALGAGNGEFVPLRFGFHCFLPMAQGSQTSPPAIRQPHRLHLASCQSK